MQNNSYATKTINIKRLFKAYPKSHTCDYSDGKTSSPATLIAMNNKSARIRCSSIKTAEAIPFGAQLDLRPGVDESVNIPGTVPCRVAWKHESELGLEFNSVLRVGIGELQRAFEKERHA